ncbi:hypothetical protein EJ05DRAFT_154941 [Pseudovirgaria hyperparasitica]|uniref:NTF2-like protein n=1 Tax=Pseudovirgaria hyperparasitica TaxID=470096 RepID=A0A6A6VXC2_9PEZI|nr:uncharacterized protein EJ05DRAFT_154941 [Pseudovirgaria hyperparasitica]KAF2754280.1 hypothetical protein EJ05DRAFT_154941 [Pseudovirgaria hyperparasitica]
MTIAGKYQRFLNSPSADALSDKASLNYITTLTTINEPLPILKHFVGQSKLLEKKSEKFLSTIDSGSALCADVETTIEFKNGGGAYLPGLDDNFLSDRVATFPVVHIVHFDEQQKITQIRQYWDQGALLKQIEIIGARGKNWPIKESKDQIKLIANSASLTPQALIDNSRPSTSSSDAMSNSQRPTSSRSATRGDPHASLNLFAPREVIEEEDIPAGPGYATRQSAKPEDRDLGELFVGEQSAATAQSTASSRKSSKAGAGKKFVANRMFDVDDDTPADSPQKTSIKTEAKRYDHFEFGDGEEAGGAPPTRSMISQQHNKKHQSQWGFEDFATPQKAGNKIQPQQERHFGWSDDEEESPVKRPVVHQPRANLKAQFEFQDDSTPEGNKKPVSNKGKVANAGMGLYKDHILGEDEITPNAKKPLENVTAQYNNENRRKDFGSQFEMKDASPAASQQSTVDQRPMGQMGQTRKNVLESGMNAGWSLYDETPKSQSKENQPRKIYNTAGNGMGGRKDAQQWNIGDDGGEAMPIRGKQHSQAQANKQTEKSFWDF